MMDTYTQAQPDYMQQLQNSLAGTLGQAPTPYDPTKSPLQAGSNINQMTTGAYYSTPAETADMQAKFADGTYNKYPVDGSGTPTLPPPPGMTSTTQSSARVDPYDGPISGTSPTLPPGTTGGTPPPGSIGVTPPPTTTTPKPTGMEVLGFPANPTAGQTYNYNGQQYTFNNGQWQKTSSINRPGPTIPGRPGPPGTATPGDPDPGDGPIPNRPVGSTGGGIGGIGGGQGGTAAPGYTSTAPNVDPYDVSDSVLPTNTSIGGISAINPQATDFDYGKVNDFADAAYQNAQRYLAPEMQLEDERFAQELINKGIDPNSDAGKKAFRQKEMSQNDKQSKAAFDAMGFGAGMQDQMFNQSNARSQLAQALVQAQWGLGQRGHEFDTTAEMQANEQAYMQMMGLEGLSYRDYQTMIDQRRYQDSLAMALAGLSNAPSYSTVNSGAGGLVGDQYTGDYNNYFSQFGGRGG